MTKTKSAKKFLIKSKIQRKTNCSNKSKLKTFIKKVNSAVHDQNKTNATSLFAIVQKTIDHQTEKGLIHKNKAARYKSRIFKKIQSIHSPITKKSN